MPLRLNPQQAQAANELDGALKIIAGAGTGKTRVLTQRYLNLINSGKATPENILCVTFTNKASDEMLERIRKEGSSVTQNTSWIMTFHKLGSRVLRRNMNLVSPSGKFNIVDSKDSTDIIKDVITQNHIATSMKAKTILNHISRAKDSYIIPEEYGLVENDNLDFRTTEQIANIYKYYQEYLDKQGFFDFGDLLCKTIDLFENHPETLEKYQEQLRYIQIDEYQDTNLVQHRLIMQLASKYKNICVVGDPDQTIYTWRGARAENLSEFGVEMKNAQNGLKTIVLEQNYRSNQHILDFANSLISHNHYREEKDLWTETTGGAKVMLESPIDEPAFICERIQQLIEDEEYNYSDICVLYRNNNMSGAIETELLRSSIPYITRDIAFYQRLEIKDSIAYLKILNDKTDDIMLQRIINTPRRGVGKASVDLLKSWAAINSVSFIEACKSVDEINGISTAAKNGVRKLLNSLIEVWEKHGTDFADSKKFTSALEDLLEKIGYMEYLAKLDGKEDDRNETSGESSRTGNVLELLKICRASDNLDEFLEAVTLDTESNETDNAPKDRVSLMTIHRAKGLEYPVVFASNMNGFAFPRNVDDADELEEERRLAYVAFTRAESLLCLTWDKYPSMFIDEARRTSKECYEINKFS